MGLAWDNEWGGSFDGWRLNRRVGLDFRPLLMTPFQEALLPPLRSRLTQANTE